MVITTARRSCSSNSSGSFFVALISAVVIVCWIGLSALPFYSVKKHSHHHRLPLAQDALLLQSSQDWSPIITATAEDDSQSYNNNYNRQLSKHLKQLKQEPSSSSQNQSQQEQQQQSSSSSSQQQQDAISIDYSKFSCDSMNDPDLMSKLQQRLEENERRKEQQQSQLQLQKSQSQRQTNKKKKKSEHEKDNSNSNGDGGGGGQEDATAADGILQQSAKKLPTTSTLSSTQPKEELLLLDKCQFAKTCNDGDGVGFGVSLFCSSSSSDNDTSSSSTTTTLHNTLTILLLLTLLLLLFRLLNSTTDEFFSPGLEHFSLQLGLPPRFAGVTLLALGNGAPDVAATMNATLDSHEGYLMALGELTGTSMFVSGVILGVIVSLNDGSRGGGGSHHNDDDDGGGKEVEGVGKRRIMMERNNNNNRSNQQQQR